MTDISGSISKSYTRTIGNSNSFNETNQENNYSVDRLVYDLKIILVGNSGVGKTSLLGRFLGNEFDKNYQCTISAETKAKKLNIDMSTSVNLKIWDTCGQEKYRSLIKNYYQNSSLAIIVYSVTDQTSFDDVNEWYKQIKLNTSPDCKIFLIANKVDLPERKITTEQGKKYKNDFKFDLFMETSAKSGFNSKELFINGATALYKEHEKVVMYEKNPNSHEEKILNNIKKKKFALKRNKDDDEEEEDEDDNEGSCCS